MKILIFSLLLMVGLLGCKKENAFRNSCNIQQTYTDNAKKATVTQGVWGTISFMEGNCMPGIPSSSSNCTNCPVQRTVKIYQYTLITDATPSGNSTIFFNSFNTPLVAEVVTDNAGFYQADIPAGQYTIAVVENGKLYANEQDGQGGLHPFTVSGEVQNVNVTLTYKATF